MCNHQKVKREKEGRTWEDSEGKNQYIRATHIGTVSAETHTPSHTRYRLINIHTEALLDMNRVGIGRGEGGGWQRD